MSAIRKKDVFVVGDNKDIVSMFMARGFEISDNYWLADLIVFTGGEDIDPKIYNQKLAGTQYVNTKRDEKEVQIFRDAITVGTPMVGICRGGQLLNALSGGSMYQDIDKHIGNHDVIDEDGVTYTVTSTHHQMMIPAKDGSCDIIAMATHKNNFVKNDQGTFKGVFGYEVLYYAYTNCLCFQPHPEYKSCPPRTRDWFFNLITNCCGVSAI